MKAPILLFVYNRPEHTRKTVEALLKNTLSKESELFIFSDGAKNPDSQKKVEEVRSYLRTILGFRSINITERKENLGLAKSIIGGVTEIVNRFGKAIVVEDDLISSPFFLEYMDAALDLYEHEEKVISIHGYVYPVSQALPETFFLRGADCWGWATWQRGWSIFEPEGRKLLSELEEKNLVKQFDLDGAYNFSGMLKRQIAGKNDSWAIRWHASAFLAEKLTLYPGRSLILNTGRDGSGTHEGRSLRTDADVRSTRVQIEKIEVRENSSAKRIVSDYLRSFQRPSLLERISARFQEIF